MSDKKYEDITLKRIKQLKGTDSQDAFAKKIKTTQSNVSKLLRGSPPSAATLKALAETYHVSVDWLLGLSDEMEIANKAHFHDLTADTLTYGDVMAVLEVLYEYLSILNWIQIPLLFGMECLDIFWKTVRAIVVDPEIFMISGCVKLKSALGKCRC